MYILVELLRAKRTSRAPWVRIFGKPMRPRKFGAYARPFRLSGRGSGVLRQPDRGLRGGEWAEGNGEQMNAISTLLIPTYVRKQSLQL